MPIYEYVCRACSLEFEAIVRGREKAVCPGCGGRRLEKRHSAFAVGAHPDHGDAVRPCGRCGDPRGAGACSID